MPVHGTPRELFKVLLDAFKVGLIKAFNQLYTQRKHTQVISYAS
jgi:hypothetical protein